VALLAFACRGYSVATADSQLAGCAAIDRYLLLAGPTAANPLQLHAVAGWDREADRHLTVA